MRTRSTMDGQLTERIERLRRNRMPMRRIAQIVGRSVATISRVLARLGLSSLRALEPKKLVVRYARQAPGELLHMDMKKLARIAAPDHRVTSNWCDHTRGVGWKVAYVAIDDHSRVGFVQMYLEKKVSAVAFLRATVAHYKGPGGEYQTSDHR